MPCIANIISVIDQMYANLLTACNNENYSSEIHTALKIGMNLLNKYYLIMDNSEVYWIAMSMLKFTSI